MTEKTGTNALQSKGCLSCRKCLLAGKVVNVKRQGEVPVQEQERIQEKNGTGPEQKTRSGTASFKVHETR